MQTGKENTDNLTGPVEIPKKLKQSIYPAALELFSDMDPISIQDLFDILIYQGAEVHDFPYFFGLTL